MRFSVLPLPILLPVLSFLTQGRAQLDNESPSAFLEDYLSYLNSCGYTAIWSALSQANQTEAGQSFLSKISTGNWTFFVPTNEAVSNASSNVTNNATLWVEYLPYHFVYGNLQNTSFTNTSSCGEGGGSSTTSTESSSSTSTDSSSSSVDESTTSTATASAVSGYRLLNLFTDPSYWSSPGDDDSDIQLFSGVYPNDTIGRTLLNSSDLVMLEGNKSQVLAWTRSGENGNVTILNQASNSSSSQNITVSNSTQWRNILLVEINGVLIPPGNISTALVAVNDSLLIDVASLVQVPLANGTNGTAIDSLQSARGFTLFAPNTDAHTSDVNKTIESLRNNQTALLAILQNHYVNGTTVYSPTIRELAYNASQGSTTNLTSAAGEQFSFSSNETGLFVNGGNGTSAQIVRPDVLVNNGVIHIIDRVLINEASDPAAASSAYASASSVATETSTDTMAIGIFPIPTSSGSSGSGSTVSTSSTSSASNSETSSASSASSSSESSTSSTSSSSSSSSSSSESSVSSTSSQAAATTTSVVTATS